VRQRLLTTSRANADDIPANASMSSRAALVKRDRLTVIRKNRAFVPTILDRVTDWDGDRPRRR
jgi:hypothetical protein